MENPELWTAFQTWMKTRAPWTLIKNGAVEDVMWLAFEAGYSILNRLHLEEKS